MMIFRRSVWLVLPWLLAACGSTDEQDLQSCRTDRDCQASFETCHAQEAVCYEEALDTAAPQVVMAPSPYFGRACPGGCLLNELNEPVTFEKQLETFGMADDHRWIMLNFAVSDTPSLATTPPAYLQLQYQYWQEADGERRQVTSWTDLPDDGVSNGVRTLHINMESLTGALAQAADDALHGVEVRVVDLAGRVSETLTFTFYLHLSLPPVRVTDCQVSEEVLGLNLREGGLASFYGGVPRSAVRANISWAARSDWQVNLVAGDVPDARTEVVRTVYRRGPMLAANEQGGDACVDAAPSYTIQGLAGTCQPGALPENAPLFDEALCERDACETRPNEWNAHHAMSLRLPDALQGQDQSQVLEVLVDAPAYAVEALHRSGDDGYILQDDLLAIDYQTDTSLPVVYFAGEEVLDELRLTLGRPSLGAYFGSRRAVDVVFDASCADPQIWNHTIR